MINGSRDRSSESDVQTINSISSPGQQTLKTADKTQSVLSISSHRVVVYRNTLLPNRLQSSPSRLININTWGELNKEQGAVSRQLMVAAREDQKAV